ncbi:MAG: flagellar biosynthesis anti-sigma factor FlgM [Gammaproteobacteria bacterium]|nr:flagellar biosynthesis anti-sigma factor FlgM [Gammaproteobacteria bacterium]
MKVTDKSSAIVRNAPEGAKPSSAAPNPAEHSTSNGGSAGKPADVVFSVAGPQASPIESVSDSELVQSIKEKIQAGTFKIDYDSVAASILTDAIALAGSRTRASAK